ncbi:MAG: MFS transporter [Chthoniobacter sp.]
MGALPIIFLSLPAGIAADRLNRKAIILITQLLSGLTSVGLTILALEHVSVPAIGHARLGNARPVLAGRIVRRKDGE